MDNSSVGRMSSVDQRVARHLARPTVRSDTDSAEHDRPHSDKFALVDVSVVVNVEGAHKLTRLRLVVAERLTDDGHQLVRT